MIQISQWISLLKFDRIKQKNWKTNQMLNPELNPIEIFFKIQFKNPI